MNNSLLYLSLILLAGIAAGRLVKQARLPNVTGYLLIGLLIGPHLLGLIPEGFVEGAYMLSDAALGFIAFSIGGEFKVTYLRKVGKGPVLITILEAMGAVVLVLAGLLIAGFPLPLALCLGAIAAATAPAATIMVIRQYKAKGPLTDTLMTVVAMDDAVALMAFGIAAGIARTMTSPGNSSIWASVFQPLLEIVLSLGLGFLLGLVMAFPLRWFKKDGNRTILMLGFVLLGVGLAELFDLSGLLLCMAAGAALVNLSGHAPDVFRLAEGFTPPLFLAFFVLSGAEMNLSILPSVGLAGALYILLRVAGKIGGSYLGALLGKAPVLVRRWLGPALVPQAGVAIGLSLAATKILPEYGDTIRAVVLSATILYEVVGPVLAKLSLKKAGEIPAE